MSPRIIFSILLTFWCTDLAVENLRFHENEKFASPRGTENLTSISYYLSNETTISRFCSDCIEKHFIWGSFFLHIYIFLCLNIFLMIFKLSFSALLWNCVYIYAMRLCVTCFSVYLYICLYIFCVPVYVSISLWIFWMLSSMIKPWVIIMTASM